MEKIAEFGQGGEVRRVSIGVDAGAVMVREDTRGPVTQAVFGEEERSHRMVFSPEALERAKEALAARDPQGGGAASALASFLAERENCLADLMDLCDVEGIPYAFCGVGSTSGVQFRAAA